MASKKRKISVTPDEARHTVTSAKVALIPRSGDNTGAMMIAMITGTIMFSG